MERLFDIRVSTEGSLIASLRPWRLKNSPSPYPSYPLPGHLRSPAVLNIYTYMAEVSSLTCKNSPVVRKDTAASGVPILVARVEGDDEEIAFMPDFAFTAGPEGDFVLAMIGKGERSEGTGVIDPSGCDYNLTTTYIVLLLKKCGEHFERVGLSIALAERNIPEEKGPALWKRSLINKLALKNIGKRRFERQYYIDPPACWVLRWVSLV